MAAGVLDLAGNVTRCMAQETYECAEGFFLGGHLRLQIQVRTVYSCCVLVPCTRTMYSCRVLVLV